MSEMAIEMAASEEVVLPVLTRLNHGNIDDAIARFAERIQVQRPRDRIGVQRQRAVDSILVSLDHVVSEWTLHTNVTEPFYGALSRKVRILVQGVSVVRTKNGEITEWSDYYDGLTSRRTALAAHFTDWASSKR